MRRAAPVRAFPPCPLLRGAVLRPVSVPPRVHPFILPRTSGACPLDNDKRSAESLPEQALLAGVPPRGVPGSETAEPQSRHTHLVRHCPLLSGWLTPSPPCQAWLGLPVPAAPRTRGAARAESASTGAEGLVTRVLALRLPSSVRGLLQPAHPLELVT